MKIIALFILVFITACSSNETKHKPATNSFILSNINIVDVKNKTILQSKIVVIKNGKIQSVADNASLELLSQYDVIDGKGGYITPGLIDMHVHMYEKAAYILTLSHGVTHVRVMNGVPAQLLWRDNINTGIQLGSTSSVSSPILSGYEDASLHHFVDTYATASKAVKDYHAMGYDLIKAYGNLNEQALSGIVDTGRELNIPIAKHGPHASGDMALSHLSGLQSFEHVEDIYQGPLNYKFSIEKLNEVIPALKATDVPVTPTLNIFYQLTKLSQEKEAYLAKTSKQYTSDIIAYEASGNQVQRWLEASDKIASYNQKVLRFLQDITKALFEHEIPLLVGSDSGVLLSPHGLATHNEMRLLTNSDIGAFDVLAAATINPAKALNLEKQIGQILPSYTADFIYSTSNPIDNLSVLKEPEAVAKNGYWYSKEVLHQMRADAINARSFWDELFVLFDGL